MSPPLQGRRDASKPNNNFLASPRRECVEHRHQSECPRWSRIRGERQVAMRLRGYAILVVACLAFSGCASQRVQFTVDGPKYPSTVALAFGPKISALTNAETAKKPAVIGLTNEDLYNHIRTAFTDALRTGFADVADVGWTDAGGPEDALEPGIAGIVSVELNRSSFWVPFLRLMSYSATLDFAVRISDKTGRTVYQGTISGYDSDILILGFVEFQAKSKYNQLADNAARKCAAEVLRKTYSLLKPS